MYYVATLILEYEKMVKAINLRELTPKVLCQILYKCFILYKRFILYLPKCSLFYKQSDNGKKAQVT